jgi:hypothetical protein
MEALEFKMGQHQLRENVQFLTLFFQVSEEFQEKHRYPALTKELKAKVFGLNAAKLFGVDVDAKREELPKDYLSHIKMAYLEEGPSPSHHAYGWVTS